MHRKLPVGSFLVRGRMILQSVIMMICCRKKAVDTTDSYDEADYQESVQLDDEGCYEVTAR